MIRIQFKRYLEPDPVPTWIDGSTRAVPAQPFADMDGGHGGITRAYILDETIIAPLDTFAPGSEVYIESEDPTDCLEDDDVEAERRSRIWWLGFVVGK